MSAIERAIKIVGTQEILAAKLKVSQQLISYWKRTGNVSPTRCIQIEKLTAGQVTRYQLRGDIFGKSPTIARG